MAEKKLFGVVDGKEIYNYTIHSENLTLSVMELGATITELFTPDKSGKSGDVAVGFASAEDYAEYTDNQGATVGRYANRIKKGEFSIDGKLYRAPCNDGNNMLHGNNEFRDAIWTLSDSGDNFLKFTYVSPDGSNGFPGKLNVSVKFILSVGSLKIHYDAFSDKKTVICLTNHLYFNLTANPANTVYNHILQINAENFTPVDSELIPTGEVKSVGGTALDFRTPKPLGMDIEADETVKGPGGYDVNFCIDGDIGTLREAAVISEPVSGRKMTVFTDMPGMQVYSGNWLKNQVGKYGIRFTKHGAVCLETQFYPDTPNHANFPQCTFNAGEHFISDTIYKFDD